MLRRKTVKNLPSDSSDDEPLAKKVAKNANESAKDDDSSSDSDIENYLQRADKLDLDSPFFDVQKDKPSSFDKIESAIFTGVSRLSDSEDEDETEEIKPEAIPSTSSKLNFRQLHEYTKKLEEAKKHVEKYNAKKKLERKQDDVSNLLAVGESKLRENKTCHEVVTQNGISDSEGEEDFEEVLEQQKAISKVPTEGLQITVEMPGAVKKKKGVDLLTAIKRRLNRVRKENQVLIHKVHLLCWIAHGNYVSSVINSQNVLGVALSLLPSEKCYPADRTDLSYLEQVVKWYSSTIVNVDKPIPNDKSLGEILETQITKKEALNKKMKVLIFIAILRSLGIQCRLVLSFQLEPLRPSNSELCSLSTKNYESKSEQKVSSEDKKACSKSTSTVVKSDKIDEKKTRSKSKHAVEEKSNIKLKASSKNKKPEERKTSTKYTKEDIKDTRSNIRKKSKSMGETKKSEATSLEVETKKSEKPKCRSKTTTSSSNTSKADSKKTRSSTENSRSKKIPQLDGANDSSADEFLPQIDGTNDEISPKPNLKKLNKKESTCSIRNHPKRLKNKTTKYKDSSCESDDSDSPYSKANGGVNLKKLKELTAKTKQKKAQDVRNDIIDIVKSRIKEQKQIDCSKKVQAKRKSVPESDDSDYVPEAPKKKHRDSDDDVLAPKVKVKRRVGEKIEEDPTKTKRGVDVWVEVYLEMEEKWISADVIRGQVHCVSELFTRASHPVSYIVAWNNDNSLKDITSRYCKNFNTITRKLRIDSKWWEASLKPFKGKKTARDREEDEELEKLQLEKPLPTVISEYKNHPLYALKRHLLKFEAIYPPDAPTLGFCRNEPVYSRQCVYTLHSREIWLKHARVVKPGEKPYKIVKARPKWDKLSNKAITDLELEIFGIWQTQDYEPPTAENGVVPRNAYGNVELFKPTMLPKKTVHLQLPGLNKVAKRLNIDCAAAVIGFDFHGGWNHAVYDGFVVCEEFRDVLIKAWEEEQEEIAKKEREKIDKRVYGNWKRLIRGLLIRERLKIKYEFGEPSASKKKGKNVQKTPNKK